MSIISHPASGRPRYAELVASVPPPRIARILGWGNVTVRVSDTATKGNNDEMDAY